MKRVRLLKDWSFHKRGDVVEVFDPTAKNWIETGIAEQPEETREIVVEQAVTVPPDSVERAVVSRKQQRTKGR